MDNDVIKIAKKYADSVRKDFSPKAVYLYGSYARGNPHKDSDIDIAVVYKNFKGDYWSAINALTMLILSIDTRIEPVLLEIDNDPSGFVEQVLTEGIRV